MPRRRPAAVRAGRPARAVQDSRASRALDHDRPTRRQPRIDGLSATCAADIRRLEHRRFSPGRTYESFRYWAGLAHGPLVNLTRDIDTCGIPDCGCDPAYHRDHLETVLHTLPPRSARELRALVHRLDATILRRASGIPCCSPDAPWWRDHF